MAGAMEDWGLVSFRSAYVIFDKEIMTVESMRQVTLVIAHELAHQVSETLVQCVFIFGGARSQGLNPTGSSFF